MRDQVNDEAVGKNTLVVKLGFRNAKIYHGLLFVIAYLAFPLPLLITEFSILNLLLILPVALIHALHLWRVYKVCKPVEFDPELKKVALSAFLFSLLVWAMVIFR